MSSGPSRQAIRQFLQTLRANRRITFADADDSLNGENELPVAQPRRVVRPGLVDDNRWNSIVFWAARPAHDAPARRVILSERSNFPTAPTFLPLKH
jgi:hypothetical protein